MYSRETIPVSTGFYNSQLGECNVMSQKPTYEELAQKIALLEDELSARKRSEALKDALLHIFKAVCLTTSYETERLVQYSRDVLL